MPRQSLSSFCKLHNLPKSTVYKFLQSQGYGTSDGLSPEAVKAASAYFLDEVTEPAMTPEVMPDGFIQAGKLQPVDKREIQMPQGFDPAEMVRFFDGVAGQATDTKSLAAIGKLAIEAVDRAMDEKLKAQRAELSQAEKDAQMLDKQFAEAKTRMQIKALESKMLAERQTNATLAAEEAFAELMALGKPQPAEASQDNGNG